jgi:hypothetical protein
LTVAASGVWASSLRDIDLRQLTDIGLVSQLPPASYAGLALVTLSFCLALRTRPLLTPLVVVNVLVLVVMLYGITTFVEQAPRISITWLHAGFTETISRTGELPALDARFEWPVFFILAGFITAVAGLESALVLAPWMSLALNLLCLGPLVLIFRSATADARLVWLAVWVFYLGNWVGQDYFSPQGFNYLVYLATLAILLTTFGVLAEQLAPWDRTLRRIRLALFRRPITPLGESSAVDQRGSGMPLSGAQRAGAAALVILLYAVQVSSHQLTPFVVLAGVVGLVVFNRLNLRGLPILMAVMVAAWISYMTVDYLSGHLPSLVASIGEADQLTRANLTNRLRGSPEHLLVVYARVGMTLALWALALAGALRRVRNGQSDVAFGVLAVSPFGLLWLHGYGGELLLRVYIFSLPFVSFFVAGLFHPLPLGARWRTTGALLAASLVLVVGFLITRYGNERSDVMTPDEVSAVEYVYTVAEPGSLLASINYNSPLGYRDYEKYRYRRLGNRVVARGDVDETQRVLADNDSSYLIITRSQEAQAAIFAGVEKHTWTRFVDRVRASGSFEVVFENRDATIFRLREPRSPP